MDNRNNLNYDPNNNLKQDFNNNQVISQNPNNNNQPINSNPNVNTKFCKFCGERIDMDSVICIKCGKQVEELKVTNAQPNIIINNSNDSVNTNLNTNQNNNYINANAYRKVKNKWVSLLLCLFLGYLGAHKFYEGKIGMGILYLLTFGIFGIGIVIDLILILLKPNPYYV